MYIQELKNAENEKKSSKRVGRGIGSGMGKTSTRGHKGQWARTGGGVRPNFEGGQMPLTRRVPKRGFNNAQFAHVYSEVNVGSLEIFENGEVVDAAALLERRVLSKIQPYGIKILGNGELTKSLTVKAEKFTGSAKEKIEKAGGKVEEVK